MPLKNLLPLALGWVLLAGCGIHLQSASLGEAPPSSDVNSSQTTATSSSSSDSQSVSASSASPSSSSSSSSGNQSALGQLTDPPVNTTGGYPVLTLIASAQGAASKTYYFAAIHQHQNVPISQSAIASSGIVFHDSTAQAISPTLLLSTDPQYHAGAQFSVQIPLSDLHINAFYRVILTGTPINNGAPAAFDSSEFR